MRKLLYSLLLAQPIAFSQTIPSDYIPFNSAIYGMYVMPNPEVGRNYTTADARTALNYANMNGLPSIPNGFSVLGTWITKDATHDPFHIYGEDRMVPGILIVYTLDVPGPPTISKKSEAIIINVQRPTLSANEFRLTQKGQARAAISGNYQVLNLNNEKAYKFCRQSGGQDYKPFNSHVKSNCTIELRRSNLTIIVKIINMKEDFINDYFNKILKFVN